jgi:hypothetical protein
MRRFIRGLLFASAAPLLAILAAGTVQAQPADISFDSFHDQLSSYGDWLYSDRWGEVWRPWQQDQDPDWRPYSVGHWAYTDEYGWTWISDEGPWADIAYHYGRWVFDPDDGWLWLAGYVWSPAWVVWRSAGPNMGWMPMPPDDAFLGNGGPTVSVSVNFGDWSDTGGFYGYSRWYGPRFNEDRFGALWTFVPAAHVADPAYRNYAVPRPQVVNVIRVSRNVTNYTVVNNVIINKSVNITMVQGAGGRPVAPVHAAAVLHSTRWVAPVNRGQQLQAQMRQLHPRGNGLVKSAPPPTPQQIRTLSPRPVPARGGPATGGAPHHLFSQTDVTQIQTGKPAPNAPAFANNPAMQRPPAGPGLQRPPVPPAANEAPRPPRQPEGPAANETQHPFHEAAPPGEPARRESDPGALPPRPMPPATNQEQRPQHAPVNPGANETPRPAYEDRSLREPADRVKQVPRQHPVPAEARPPRPAETMQPHRPTPPPRPAAQPKPAPHPRVEHAGSRPERGEGDRKPEH